MEELLRLDARAVAGLLAKGEVSPREVVDLAAARHEQVDDAVNALPTPCFDRARKAAAKPQAGPLHGLPVAIKDLTDVAGLRCTLGSAAFAERIADTSDIVVQTLESRGGIVIGKSNTPEFGAGAQTFNEVFGVTRNPWNTALTPGGSSGGSAVAVATGQAWLAHGTDLGGSLRIPAAFSGVVGLRPSPGRVARGPDPLPYSTLDVHGPLARSVGDAALMLDAMSGAHPFDPLSLPRPEQPFTAAVDAPRAPRRIAWSPDLGVAPVDREIKEVCARAVARFAGLGVAVEEAHPDLSDAETIFQTLRAAHFAMLHAPTLERQRDKLKPEVVWNIEKGLALDADTIGKAERARAALVWRCTDFFTRFDLLACPVTVVPPFDVTMRYPTEAGGVAFATYISWVAPTFAITLTGCPALSLPCGFTRNGLPVGLQLIAPPRGEAALLSAAALLEAELALPKGPIDVKQG
ncbi:amidase [Telmatospirillum sp. J64-1]|uniref:amidase n=1 Tax=Telmatospirillum sp. J64-1 TaxID=2502183 RepID=UPI00115D3D17|nr:amidase family protein [Telmatospirillum sp. J64-1]